MLERRTGDLVLMAVDKHAVGECFVQYCVNKGWLVKETKNKKTSYLLTRHGITALRRYGLRFDE
jgi:hypothetical protein